MEKVINKIQKIKHQLSPYPLSILERGAHIFCVSSSSAWVDTAEEAGTTSRSVYRQKNFFAGQPLTAPPPRAHRQLREVRRGVLRLLLFYSGRYHPIKGRRVFCLTSPKECSARGRRCKGRKKLFLRVAAAKWASSAVWFPEIYGRGRGNIGFICFRTGFIFTEEKRVTNWLPFCAFCCFFKKLELV